MTKWKIITKLFKSDYAEKDSWNWKVNKARFSQVAQATKFFFFWVVNPGLSSALSEVGSFGFYLFFQTPASSTEPHSGSSSNPFD